MTVYVWPIDPQAGVPVYAARAVREAHSAFLAGATTARPLGAHSGVRPGTSQTTVTATSTTWTVGSHAGIIDLETAVDSGPYNYAVNAVGGLPSGAITAADATRPRVDIVYARIDDAAEGDSSGAAKVVFGYLAGVPLAGSPVPPAAPNSRCMILAWINVPLSGGGAPTVTWKAPYAVAAGAPVPVWSAAERDALIAYDGLQVYRLDLHAIEVYNGTAWVSSLNPVCRVMLGGAAVNTPSAGTFLMVPFAVDVADPNNMHAAGTDSRIFVPISGYYEVTGKVVGTASGCYYAASIFLNGISDGPSQNWAIFVAGAFATSIAHTVLYATAGQYFELGAASSVGGQALYTYTSMTVKFVRS